MCHAVPGRDQDPAAAGVGVPGRGERGRGALARGPGLRNADEVRRGWPGMARYRTEQPFAGPPDVVFDYLSHFESVAEWDPGVSEATRLDDGPLAVGSRFRVVVKTGPLVYEVAELDPGRRIRLVAESSTVRSDDVITVLPATDGATVSYDADLTLRGWAVVFSPLLGIVFGRIGDRAAAGLRARLDELARAL